MLAASPLASLYAQITLDMKNTAASEVVKRIEKISDYRFFYNKGLDAMNRKITINVRNQSFEEVMKQMCRQLNVTYVIKNGNQVVLKNLPAGSKASSVKKTIKGTVKDADGEPLPSASVGLKGDPKVKVATDIDGNFTIEVPDDASLEVSYIGYAPRVVEVGDNNFLDITMSEDNTLLDEVIVVGYGTQKKINKTGSVAQIGSKELSGRPVQNLSSALQGLMPGVSVSNSTGKPGSDNGSIRIRGVGTLNSADPYILVDGVETGTLNTIDPADVESISVLKDAASAAIYGSKASNGVILITTKRGQQGKTRVNYTANVGFQNPTNLTERMSSYDYARILNDLRVGEGLAPRFTDEEIEKFRTGNDPMYPNTDWYDEILKNGFQFNNSVSISGGTEKGSYMGSIGYMHQDGIIEHSKRRQINARTNLDMKVNDRLSVKFNLAFVQNSYSDPTSSYAGGSSAQIFRLAQYMAPWIVARYPDGTYGTVSDGSPVAWLDAGQTVDNKSRNFTGLVSADYEIISGLKATVTGAYVANDNHYREFQKEINYNPNKVSDVNHLNESFGEWNRPSLDVLLNYNRSFGGHNLTALGGWHMEKYNYSSLSGYRKNFPNNDLQDMNAGDAASQTNGGYHRNLSMISWFGRINYDYRSRYLFEANFRADASSRFAKGNRWGYFPSFSAGWRISEESFMEGTRDWLTSLKLRGSWGLLGNQNALSDYYPWMNTYNVGANYLFGDVINTGHYQGSYKLETISWEKARTWGIGIDATLWNTFNLSVEYYDRKTNGIIMDVPVPAEFGLGAYKDNVGSLVNRGIEISLGYNKQWGDWRFGANANVTWNVNKLLDLGGVDSMVDPNDKNKRRQIGQRINSYYVYKGEKFFQSDEEAQAYMDKYASQQGYPFSSYTFKGGDIIYEDTNGDGKITLDDRVIVGSTDPSVTFGLNLTGGWKGLDISMIWSGAADVYRTVNNEVMSYFLGDTTHPATKWFDAWTPENTDASMPRLFYSHKSPSDVYNVVSSFWVQNTSHVRLKNLQLGYTIPKSWIKSAGIENLRVFYSAENLFTIGCKKFGIDPEGYGSTTYPLLRTNSFGVNLSF